MGGTNRSGRQRNAFGPFYIRTQEGDWGPFSLNDIRKQHAAGKMPAHVEIRDAGRNVMVLVGDLLADAVDQSKAGETAVGTDLPPIVVETNSSRGYGTTSLTGSTRSNTTLSVTALPGHLDPIDDDPLERRWVPPPPPPPPVSRFQPLPPPRQPDRYQTTAPTRRRTAGAKRGRRPSRGSNAGIDPTVLVLLIGGVTLVAVLLYSVIAHGGRSGKPAFDHFMPLNRQ